VAQTRREGGRDLRAVPEHHYARRLTDEERKLAPPVGGTWDEARRRVVFTDGGDVVVLDTVARTRQQVTRTTAPESGPRWARNDTAVTFVSQNNLFIVPLATGSIEQLTT